MDNTDSTAATLVTFTWETAERYSHRLTLGEIAAVTERTVEDLAAELDATGDLSDLPFLSDHLAEIQEPDMHIGRSGLEIAAATWSEDI